MMKLSKIKESGNQWLNFALNVIVIQQCWCLKNRMKN